MDNFCGNKLTCTHGSTHTELDGARTWWLEGRKGHGNQGALLLPYGQQRFRLPANCLMSWVFLGCFLFFPAFLVACSGHFGSTKQRKLLDKRISQKLLILIEKLLSSLIAKCDYVRACVCVWQAPDLWTTEVLFYHPFRPGCGVKLTNNDNNKAQNLF